MQVWLKRLLSVSVLIQAGAFAFVANGWEKEGRINASVHDHVFHKMVIEQLGDGCVVNFRLSFRAPSAGYSDPEKGRNYYRFKARVKLSEGETVYSPQFANNKPGNRAYWWSEDTTEAGCWGKKLHKLYNVDVEGCRNRNCRVRPFE